MIELCRVSHDPIFHSASRGLFRKMIKGAPNIVDLEGGGEVMYEEVCFAHVTLDGCVGACFSRNLDPQR